MATLQQLKGVLMASIGQQEKYVERLEAKTQAAQEKLAELDIKLGEILDRIDAGEK